MHDGVTGKDIRMLRNVSGSRVGCLLCLSAWVLAADAADKSQPPLIVFAAASLTDALHGIGNAFTTDNSTARLQWIAHCLGRGPTPSA